MQARSQLLPLLRSALVGDLLAWLYLHPEESYSQRELAGRLAVTQSTVSREADRLVSAGLISEERRGNFCEPISPHRWPGRSPSCWL